MTRGKRIMGILMILVAIMMLFFWETKGKDLTKETIPTLKKSVDKGTIITEKMIEYVHSDCKEKYIRKEDIGEIIGKQTVCPVHKGVPIFSEYFSQAEVEPDRKNGRVIMAITGQMVINSWGPVRPGDSLLIYKGDQLIAEGKAAAVYEEQRKIDMATDETSVANVAKALSEGARLIIVRG